MSSKPSRRDRLGSNAAEGRRARPSGLAIAAVVVGLLLCVPGAGLLALLLAYLAHRTLLRHPELSGEGWIAAAVALGLLTTLGQILAFFVWATTTEFFSTLAEATEDVALYEVAVDSGRRRLVFDGAGEERCPAYTPDGRQIVFASPQAGTWDLWRVPREGGAAQRITTLPGQEHRPRVSPDGRQVAFLYQGPDLAYGIGVVPLEGGEARFLLQKVEGLTGVDFSPDGTRLVVTASPPGRDAWTRIYDLETGGRRTLKIQEDDWEDLPQTDPDWSEDRIRVSAGHTLVEIDPETGATHRPMPGRVVHTPRVAAGRLFFSSNFDPETGREEGTWRHLLVGTLEGRGLRRILSTEIPLSCIDVAPDGTHLAAGLPSGEAGP
ncbi:MAG: hypothetical protein D6729_14745 [Deltaproteobacteria bacterium]|nr:MAG: hypothetical protein D6729_14745 [Deltaproteobacteria bacterium]